MAQVAWMSEAWAAAAASTTPALPEVAGAEGTVSLAVSAGRREESGFHWRYEGGKPLVGSAGIDASADLVLLLAADDALAFFKGEVEPSVAFMRGRLKASGDGGLLLGFLKSTELEGFELWRRQVAALAGDS